MDSQVNITKNKEINIFCAKHHRIAKNTLDDRMTMARPLLSQLQSQRLAAESFNTDPGGFGRG